jgi:hypothetical protein
MKGGSYIIKKEGDEPELVERTQPHQDGARARDAEGRDLDSQGQAIGQAAKPKAARAIRGASSEEGPK